LAIHASKEKFDIRMLRYFFIVVFFTCSYTIFCQNESHVRGVIIDSVTIKNSIETYSLYLPERFKQNELSAIVFIFDPGGSGKNGIQPFIESAEKYNYILVCSNNSKNGPLDNNFNIINRLFETVFERFNIDEKQIYTAGFSGGSRLATAVAVLTKQVQGVIACGAGFSPSNSHIPISKENFSYVGLVGDRDMNYQEMLKVKDWLDKFQIDNEIFIYEDNHKWPSSNKILKAFAWLEIQAYKKSIRRKDEILLKESYHDFFESASLLESANQIERSVWEYERIKRNYSRFFKTDSVSKKIKQLKESRKYEEDLKNRLFIKKEEAKIRKSFVLRFSKELAAPKNPINYKWWTKELKKLNDKYRSSNNPAFQKMGERIGYAVYAMAIETAESQLREQNTRKALYCHDLVAIMIPEKPYPYFLLAIDYALLNNEDKVYENLKIAISKGLNNKKLLYNTKEFFKYKSSERFDLIVESINE
jgi:predicted esterase